MIVCLCEVYNAKAPVYIFYEYPTKAIGKCLMFNNQALGEN